MPRAQREQEILDVAGHLFARDGYHSASMDEIAQQADVSKPMLYAYFGSKEGLYVAYIERTGGELLERLERAFGEDRPRVHMRWRVGEFLKFVEQHRDGWRVLFNEASASRPVDEEVAQLRGQIIAAVRRLVEVGAAGVALPVGASDAVAHAIVGAGESLANWWLEHPEVPREDVAGWYAGIVRAIVSGVLTPA
ncbi:MAG: TetR/AcrR family transcriptional regulator [Actinomycetota bacterium]|nr:TetR/AcrR family transcriptional regulator [Actinomycetota bacterium]